MLGYVVFLIIAASILLISQLTRTNGFKKLTITRRALNSDIIEGEDFKITTVVENKKRFPISFLALKEKMPRDLGTFVDENHYFTKEYMYHTSRYSISGYERITRNYIVRNGKRGAYLLRELQITIGDVFGFYTQSQEIDDFTELLIYPKLIPIDGLELQTTSISGDNIIKRWIHKDPLYIKGIREYSVEDRMKDIHWKSSLKMNKLMVKDYDYTSEQEFVIIFNNQCGIPYWSVIDEKAVERGIHLAVSLALNTINRGIPTGLWTNSLIVNYGENMKSEIAPSLNSFKSIMELSARMDLMPRKMFHEYLGDVSKYFNRKNTYIIITPFIDEAAAAIILKLKRAGFSIKIIDVSPNLNVPFIEGIEKVNFRGEVS